MNPFKNKISRAARHLALTLLASFVLVSCGGGGGATNDNTSGGDTVLASATIGTGGGTVSTPDSKVVLNIPTGALSSKTNITVSSTGTQDVSAVYEFGPSGTTFVQPVKVKISYNPASLPSGASEDDLLLLTETEEGYLEPLTNIIVDKTNSTVSGETSHFSQYWVSASAPVRDGLGASIKSDNIPVATSFRMPIGDSRDLSSATIACNDGQSQSSQDLGSDVNLLTIGSYNNNYPKIELNAYGTLNKWQVKTTFNKDQYLTNYDTGSLEKYDSKGNFHPGEDWNLKDAEDGGRPIHSIADGIILFSQKQWESSSSKPDKTRSFGNIVVVGHKLDDGRIIASVYAHMKNLSPCSVGQTVRKGDIIGLIGSTGGSDGNHLHFEIINTSLVENASSSTGKFPTPIIDSTSKQIYINSYEQKNADGEIIKTGGWYWPKIGLTQSELIRDNYQDPSNFIKNNSSNQTTDTTPPAVPSGLAATAPFSSLINLTWNASTDNVGVAGYKIYRGGILIANQATLSYSDTGLSPSTQYCYTVSAFDAAGNVSVQSGQQCVTMQAATQAGIAAPVVTLTATPSSIAYGATSTINWSSTNSTSCTSLGGGGTGTTGSFTTPSLTTTTTYTVTCTGAGGTASQSTTVTVTPVATSSSSSSGAIGVYTNNNGATYALTPGGASAGGTAKLLSLPTITVAQVIATPITISLKDAYGNAATITGVSIDPANDVGMVFNYYIGKISLIKLSTATEITTFDTLTTNTMSYSGAIGIKIAGAVMNPVNKTIILATADGFEVVDYSNPAAPVKVREIPSLAVNATSGVGIMENFAFDAALPQGAMILTGGGTSAMLLVDANTGAVYRPDTTTAARFVITDYIDATAVDTTYHVAILADEYIGTTFVDLNQLILNASAGTYSLPAAAVSRITTYTKKDNLAIESTNHLVMMGAGYGGTTLVAAQLKAPWVGLGFAKEVVVTMPSGVDDLGTTVYWSGSYDPHGVGAYLTSAADPTSPNTSMAMWFSGDTTHIATIDLLGVLNGTLAGGYNPTTTNPKDITYFKIP